MLRIFRHYMSTAALCLFACESTVVMLVFFAAANSVAPIDPNSADAMQRYLGAVLIPALFTSILMYGLGLYHRDRLEHIRGSLSRLAAFLFIVAPVVIISLNLSLMTAVRSEGNAAILYATWTAVLFSCILLARLGYVALARATLSPHRVLVVGVGRLAAELEFLTHKGRSNTDVVGYVPLTNETPQVPEARMIAAETSVLAAARRTAAHEVVVALDDRRGSPLGPLLEARMEGIKITNYLTFWERETRRVNLKALDPSWLIYSDGFRIGTAMNALLKRALDVLASLALLLLTLPTMLLVALAISLDSAGPIVLSPGAGRPTTAAPSAMLQIPHHARRRREQTASRNGRCATTRASPAWAVILRKLRIDELPQLWNVLRGEMSFVGPRPERPESSSQSLEAAGLPFYAERHRVKPGITGWAQINYPYGASIEDARAKLAYDLYYIKNYSLLFDLLIILSTAQAVLFNKGGR